MRPRLLDCPKRVLKDTEWTTETQNTSWNITSLTWLSRRYPEGLEWTTEHILKYNLTYLTVPKVSWRTWKRPQNTSWNVTLLTWLSERYAEGQRTQNTAWNVTSLTWLSPGYCEICANHQRTRLLDCLEGIVKGAEWTIRTHFWKSKYPRLRDCPQDTRSSWKPPQNASWNVTTLTWLSRRYCAVRWNHHRTHPEMQTQLTWLSVPRRSWRTWSGRRTWWRPPTSPSCLSGWTVCRTSWRCVRRLWPSTWRRSDSPSPGSTSSPPPTCSTSSPTATARLWWALGKGQGRLLHHLYNYCCCC